MACMRDHFQEGVVLDGRYLTLSPLNHGSFGMVFLAKHIASGETVAIKCLTKKTAAGEAGLDFAIDDKSEELVLHRRLGRHPNIVNLTDSFETDTHVYIVLEYCQRGDLYEAIRNGEGPLETEHVRRFMHELVDSVEYIHARGIYHRDIKPENIFLTQSGSMKLGDFGLATTEKWTHEATVGSDRYMSPEQYDSAGAGYSPGQADIWAIGICLLNILFSRNPFTTPTETDPLFLDFSRDKQSLFDVFPSMSQDTYEVIVQCMNLDPRKRSLIGARDALNRVVSFTTLEESLDDFCANQRHTVASANREPLRTPSLQSPQVDCGAFPWAKALQTSPPQGIRQLSAIPDNESYTEELFSKSEATTTDWCSAMTAETPSMASVLDSNFGASMKSLAISQPMMMPQSNKLVQRSLATTSKAPPMAGSLPIHVSGARNIPSMSLVFGRKEAVSKSWSDMWDEEVEEEEERQKQLENLKKLNSRTWSQDSGRKENNQAQSTTAAKASNAAVAVTIDNIDDDDTPRLGLSPVTKSAAIDMPVPSIKGYDDLEDEIPFFSDPLADEKQEMEEQKRYGHQDHSDKGHHQLQLALRIRQPSPLPGIASKSRSSVDKWAALGERRRAYTGSPPPSSSSLESKSRGLTFDRSFGYSPTHGQGAWDHFGIGQHQTTTNSTVNNTLYNNNHHYIFSHGISNGHNKWNAGKDRVKERPWNKGRDWNWRQNRRPDFGGVEWVGGWSEARS